MTNKSRELIDFDESSLEFVSVLGQGGFGCVALMRDANFRLYAEKSSSLYHLRNIEKEHRIMLRFHNHPRIVQVASPHIHIGTKPERCYIYMEFASKGTLHNMISQFRGVPMPEELIGRVAFMILQGLEGLHSYGYVHCDLKPANVLLFPSAAPGEPWDLKLADFGLSKEPSTDSRSLFPGTHQYMPPETLGPYMVMGPAVDIWSLGCVVLQMFGGRAEKRGFFYAWRLPKHVSPLANNFINRCLTLHPSRRATATELLNHPFVAQRVMDARKRPLMTLYPFLKFPPEIKNLAIEEIYRKQRGAEDLIC